MLKQIFKCPVAFFHISNHHSGINTNHHETSDELASIYEEITSGTGIEVDMEKSQDSAFYWFEQSRLVLEASKMIIKL